MCYCCSLTEQWLLQAKQNNNFNCSECKARPWETLTAWKVDKLNSLKPIKFLLKILIKKILKIYSIKTTLASLGSTVKAVLPPPHSWGSSAMPWVLSQSPHVSRYWQPPKVCLIGLHESF